jgi:hypothetical protein
MICKPFIPATLALALSLTLCAQAVQAEEVSSSAAAKPAQEETKATDEKKPAAAEEEFPEFPEPVELNGFGSDEPVERADLPQRGVIVLGPEDMQHATMAHWEQYSWSKFKAKRSGRYQVRLTYSLNRTSLGMQFRIGDLSVKKSLYSAPKPKKTYLGKVFIAQPGDLPFSLLTPTIDQKAFTIHEIALIPAPEGDEVTQGKDGTITLLAKDATTWAENMRYESKPEKNCLGYWTEADDFAEWEFQVTKPGRYKVAVIHGCGGGNHGSEVEVKQADQALKFKTLDTGGFQKWKKVEVGEIEIKSSGRQRLIIDPLNKKKSAVLDVQKVVLTPVG